MFVDSIKGCYIDCLIFFVDLLFFYMDSVYKILRIEVNLFFVLNGFNL